MHSKPHNYPDFLGSEIESSPIAKSAFSILPVPYERSVSFGSGTARGPQSIIEASWQLETWDGQSDPSRLGIHTCPPVNCEGEDPEVLQRIAAAVSDILDNGSRPVVLGGEHTITYGTILGILDSSPGEFGVIQFDAHADLRDRYEDNPYSHASVMKRILDKGIPVCQFGVRALCHEEINTRKRLGIHHIDAAELVPNNIQVATLPPDFPEKVFVTVDIDGMDPSVFPSTGTPVPGGLTWYQMLGLFESVCSQKKLLGFDLVEFAPIEGFHACDFAAAQLTYQLMGIIERADSPAR